MSVNVGETISLQDQVDDLELPHRHLAAGLLPGRRRAAGRVEPRARRAPPTQPACLTDSSHRAHRLRQLGACRASWTVPSTAVSGVYIAHLDAQRHRRRAARSSSSCATTRATRTSLVQTSDATWQAYNTYGGNSLYSCTVACPPGNPAAYKAAYKVSYNRPFDTAEDDGGSSGCSSAPSTR